MQVVAWATMDCEQQTLCLNFPADCSLEAITHACDLDDLIEGARCFKLPFLRRCLELSIVAVLDC